MFAFAISSAATPVGSTPEGMREMIKQSHDTWEPVVKAAKISID